MKENNEENKSNIIYTNQFALSDQYGALQLTIHISNLYSTYGTETVTDVTALLLSGNISLDTALKTRSSNPHLFRMAQIIQSYGMEAVSKYIADVYGSVSFPEESVVLENV